MKQRNLEYELDQQQNSRALEAIGMTYACGVGMPGTDDGGGPRPAISASCEISESRTAAKWHEAPEVTKEEL